MAFQNGGGVAAKGFAHSALRPVDSAASVLRLPKRLTTRRDRGLRRLGAHADPLAAPAVGGDSAAYAWSKVCAVRAARSLRHRVSSQAFYALQPGNWFDSSVLGLLLLLLCLLAMLYFVFLYLAPQCPTFYM